MLEFKMSDKELAWRQKVIEDSLANAMSKLIDQQVKEYQDAEDEPLWDE